MNISNGLKNKQQQQWPKQTKEQQEWQKTN